MKKAGSAIPWLLLGAVTAGLMWFYASQPVQKAGDIAEYYGMTESLIRHQSIDLTPDDQRALESVLHPAYFSDPGYYVSGINGKRYPVHFVVYSILATPVRLLMRVFSANELASLAVTNVLSVGIILAILFRTIAKSQSERLMLGSLLFLSPIAFFLGWPGPDTLYLTILLGAVLLYLKRKPFHAAIATTIASWHSQPLAVPAALFLMAGLWQERHIVNISGKRYVGISLQSVRWIVIAALILVIPYLYNLYAFGVLTPWANLQDGWTLIRGFGIHNISPVKLAEQLLDPNIGLLWYAPLIVLGGLAFLAGNSIRRSKLHLALLGILVLTAFAYQTNPAWHYGTAGFGPSRHAIFAIPFFIALFATTFKKLAQTLPVLLFIAATQLGVLSQNGYFLPNFENTLKQNAIANWVLTYHPQWYNPTPEIFVDRTNHTDITYPTSAFFKVNGTCTKAYVLKTDTTLAEKECGQIPEASKAALENEFLWKANYPRTIWTVNATFWPDSESCEEWFIPTQNKPYQCMKTADDVMKYTGITARERIHQVENYPGVWRIDHGLPVRLTVPPGYIIHHYSFDGAYITYGSAEDDKTE